MQLHDRLRRDHGVHEKRTLLERVEQLVRPVVVGDREWIAERKEEGFEERHRPALASLFAIGVFALASLFALALEPARSTCF